MTNFGIGVDIERIDRFNDLAKGDERRLLEKIFTKKEIEYCFSKTNAAQHLAVRYAGKESVFKAISSTLNHNLRYDEIEITNNEKGIPNVLLKQKKFENVNITISLSHNDEFAIAFTMLEKGK